MHSHRTILALLITLILSPTTFAATAAESFAKAESLLVKGEFAQALESYAAAASADRNNAEYTQHYALVRRIVDLRSRLDAETNPQQWERIAQALRAFYTAERIYPELLALDQKVHAKQSSADSAAMLAETQLAMNQNAQAVQTLSAIPSEQAAEMTHALLGIALARTGKLEEAKQIAAKLDVSKEAGPRLTYTAARLHAMTGDSAKALAQLTSCFEMTLPSQLDGFKSHAKTCPDFAAMASSPEFAAVLKTMSQRMESKCSGGGSCAGCPMSGKCPKSQAKQ